MSTALPTRRGRGRRILLWVVLIYAVTTVVLDVVIDGYWRGLRSPQLVDVLLQMEDCRPDGPDVICFGTSRLGSGFSGDDVLHEMVQLTGNSDLEVFNASNGSQDLITADFLMERMLARGARPTLAIVELAPEMVSRHDLWLGNHAMPAPTADNLADYADALRRAWLNGPGIVADRLYPLFRCRRQLWMVVENALDHRAAVEASWPRRASWARAVNQAAAQKQQDLTSSLFLDTDQRKRRQERVADGLRTIRYWLRNYQVGGLSCAALERLLQRCGEHQVRVVLVMPPVGSEQRELYTPAIESAFQDYVSELRRRYEFRVVDCRAYLPDERFADNHHVRVPEGSLPFSLWLTREVLVPEWRGGHGGQFVAKGR